MVDVATDKEGIVCALVGLEFFAYGVLEYLGFDAPFGIFVA